MGTLTAETMSEKEATPPAYENAKAAEAAGTVTSANTTIVTQPVVTQQPQIVMQTVQLRPWSKSICQYDCGDCCYAMWCGCFVGKNVAELLGDDGLMWCCLYAWCCTCCALAQMQNEVNVLRGRMVVQPMVVTQPM